MTSRGDEYRLSAKTCFDAAHAAEKEKTRAALLELAEEWQRMAESWDSPPLPAAEETGPRLQQQQQVQPNKTETVKLAGLEAGPAEPRASQSAGLKWKASGPWRVAQVLRGARYFVAAGPFEAVAWCEPRDRGAGRYRVDIGMFRTAAEACAACELDAQRRVR